MKRVIVLQTNHQKQFHSLHTWDLGKTRFVRTHKLTYHLWRGLIPESSCTRGMFPVRMYILRITTQTRLLVISIFLATFTYAGKNYSYFKYPFLPYLSFHKRFLFGDYDILLQAITAEFKIWSDSFYHYAKLIEVWKMFLLFNKLSENVSWFIILCHLKINVFVHIAAKLLNTLQKKQIKFIWYKHICTLIIPTLNR